MDDKFAPLNPAVFRDTIPLFREKTEAFHAGELSKKDYKGFSGKYGSYAQRDGQHHMLRLRTTAGRLTKDKLNFLIRTLDEQKVPLVHFTTCQAVQLHDLVPEQVYSIMDNALDTDIVCYGGGGDYPRNVMCSPLAGVDPREAFDVLPWAEATAQFLMHFIDGPKMPRKLKVAFSGSNANEPHATFRDLGFVAREDGTFDVYAAGGLGNVPRLGVKVAEHVNPRDIPYYVVAMINTFRKYGNYENRSKARTRFMVQTLGSEEAFAKAFAEELAAIQDQDLRFPDVADDASHKAGDGSVPRDSWQVFPQKQEGLYAVQWHAVGGKPDLDVLHKVNDAIQEIPAAELRLAPDQGAWIINLTGSEADRIMDIIADDAAQNAFDASEACIGASICQVGLRDSQQMLRDIREAVKDAGVDPWLPQLHISGCPSSCASHQAGVIGLRGGIKMVDKKPVPAFLLYVNGSDLLDNERLGTELGAVAISDIPTFFVMLGQTVKDTGLTWDQWVSPEKLTEFAADWVK